MNKYTTFRIVHRYLGYFLAGIMMVYALSGIVLIFRTSDFLKYETTTQKQIAPNLPPHRLAESLKLKKIDITQISSDTIYFEQGTYHIPTGQAIYTQRIYPYVLDVLVKLHKANENTPLYWLNVCFGAALFFFALSAFWMFRPKTAIFKKGMVYTLLGLVLTLLLLFWV